MAELSKEEFEEKWARKFADNTMQDITEAVLREFRQDIADSFAGLEPALRQQWKIRTYWPVIFLTHAEAVAYGRPWCFSLDQIPPELLCSGSVARVDLHPDKYGQELILVFDERANAAEGLRAYVDGNFTRYPDLTYDGLNPQKWVKKGSLDEALANIKRYDPTYKEWALDQTMKIDFGGTDAFFSALAADGPFPPPPAAGQGTAYWKPAAPPTSNPGGGPVPAATTTTLGGVIVGPGLQVEGSGKVSLKVDPSTLGLRADGTLFVPTTSGNISPAATPTNVTAVLSNGGYTCTINWDAKAGATLYQVYRQVNGGPWTLVVGVPYNYFVDGSGVTANTFALYRITAANSVGESAPSVVAQAQ